MDFPGHFQFIFKQLNHQRLHAQLCDCVVLVGGQSFQAHRSILAACSSHFRALLSSSDSPDEVGGAGVDRGPSVMELDPEVVTPEAFSTLLDMIYTSTLSLGASNVMDVLLAASHLHLNAVVKACKLHLSRKNFPASPPKGWRSVKQQQGQCPPSQTDGAASLQQVCSVMEDSDDEDAVVVVSQSGVGEGPGRRRDGEENAVANAARCKRKSQEDGLGCKKKSCRLSAGSYKECSPTVTSRGTVSPGIAGEYLLSPDCLMSADELLRSRGDEEEEEVEQKYEAGKAESEEIQLPSQSDSGAGAWTKDGDASTVMKVKVGDGGGEDEEPKMPVIEVKKENLCTYPPELEPPPLSPPKDCLDGLNGHVDDEGTTMDDYPVVGGVTSLQSQLCTDPDTGDLCEDSEGLDSLSELAFSCFLNPSAESVMGALEEDDSLASLTAAATAAAASASEAPSGNIGTEDISSVQCSDSSSLVFPLNSTPLQQQQQQQLLPNQSSSFSDALLLQPSQNPLTGFLSGIRPGLTLEVSLVPPSPPTVGKSAGATTFRRIAPKVPPGSEAGAEPATDAVTERPSLTRASEDVLSKCKKAAAEDHVLLVEGEKKYACNICCKTFMNLTDCKKHIRVHTGEKPYPCLKCGKRFSQSSHLYKHSKNTCDNWREDQSLQEPLL